MRKRLLKGCMALLCGVLVVFGLAGCNILQDISRIEITPPTCTERGYTTQTFSWGYSYRCDYVEPLGHDEVVDAAVAPTCTETGLTEGKHCSVCGEVLVVQKIVAVTGHNYTEEVIAPTPTTAGYTIFTCKNCEDTYTENYEQEAIDLEYQLIETVNGKAYEVVGIGAFTDDELVIPSTYLGLPVTSIGEGAFQDCHSLTSVKIGNRITSIDSYAFARCSSLTSVEIPDSVTSVGHYAFENCSSLKYNEYENAYYLGNKNNPYSVLIKAKAQDIASCIIHNNTKVIYQSAFVSCSSLTSIEIPDGVTSIGWYAFAGCSSLTSIEIPDSVTSIGSSAFGNCESLKYNEYNNAYYLGNKSNPYLALIKAKASDIASCIIHNNTKVMCEYAFVSCSSLTGIEIPDSVTSIGRSVFDRCSGLTSVVIGNSVTSIGVNAFQDCYNLTSIEIPDSVTIIRIGAFGSCGSLTSVAIGDGVKRIVYGAFDGCYSLTSITVDENNTVYKDIDGNLYSKDGKTLIQYVRGKTEISFTIPDSVTSIGAEAFGFCTSLMSVVIPDSVTSIGSGAFYGCSGLTSIEIPDSVTSIGSRAFYYCRSLTSIEIPDSVTSIGNSAFAHCNSLTSIEIPDSVTSIGAEAFGFCTSLMSVVIPDSVTSIGDGAFVSCSSLTSIEIPDGVTSIGGSAFGGCSSLTSITFEGTMAEWDNIEKGANWNVSVPATQVVCSDGTVER